MGSLVALLASWGRKVVWVLIAFFMVLAQNADAGDMTAATWHVDGRNSSGTMDGTATYPFTTIEAALNAATSGDAILVAAGNYMENVVIDDKRITLRGGYPGADGAAYSDGAGGDFSDQEPAVHVSHIQAMDTAAVILLRFTEASGSVIDGFTLSGGAHGILLDTAVTWPHIADLVISRNRIENNGVMDVQHRGGGLSITGPGHVIEDNVIRNNMSGRGAGMTIFGEDIEVVRNTIEDNISYDDHGGGIYQGGTVLIRENIIRGNRTGEDLGYGWGGGVLILGTATMRFNRILENHAPSIGGGVFVDEGGTATMAHELIYGNTTDGAGGAGVYVDGGEGPSLATITHSTIAYNVGAPGSEGNGVYVERESSAILLNSIVWGNGGDDFYHDAGSTIESNYTLSEEMYPGLGNLSSDPLFANPAAGDFHLQSTAGRFDPEALDGTGDWVMDAVDSPAIDRADPASPFLEEPMPNGGRANLGAYGNTAEASRSADAGEGETEGTGSEFTHTGDQNGDGIISLSELLRVIQFFNSSGYGCNDGTEDGYAPNGLDQGCTPHSSDYNPMDWRINLSELLRLIQFFNSGAYHPCLGSEDGYCPGQGV